MFKNTRHMGRWIVIGLTIGLFCSSAALAKKPPKPPTPPDLPTYSLVDLLGIPDNTHLQSQAVALSEPDEAGGVLVVGNSHNPGPTPAFWSVNGEGAFAIEDINLGIPPGATSGRASDVNDLGVVTLNTWQTDLDVYPAWVLVPGLPLQELPRTGNYAKAYALNNGGELVGLDNGGALWRLDEIGTPSNPISLGNFYPADINDQGVMVGTQGNQAAMAWFDEGGLHVQSLGPASSEAIAVSENGTWVAGNFKNYNGDYWTSEAFVWTPETGMVGLGTLSPKAASSHALGVNNAGQVVGWGDTGGGKHSQTAFFWQNGRMVDLNSLVDAGEVHLGRAERINEAGHVVGSMGIPRPVSEMHGFLLVPQAE